MQYQNPEELQLTIGKLVQDVRFQKHKTQREVAQLAGVSLRSVISLENGAGSTLSTFIRVLKALNADDRIMAMLPERRISPMSLLKVKSVQRIKHSRKDIEDNKAI